MHLSANHCLFLPIILPLRAAVAVATGSALGWGEIALCAKYCDVGRARNQSSLHSSREKFFNFSAEALAEVLEHPRLALVHGLRKASLLACNGGVRDRGGTKASLLI